MIHADVGTIGCLCGAARLFASLHRGWVPGQIVTQAQPGYAFIVVRVLIGRGTFGKIQRADVQFNEINLTVIRLKCHGCATITAKPPKDPGRGFVSRATSRMPQHLFSHEHHICGDRCAGVVPAAAAVAISRPLRRAGCPVANCSAQATAFDRRCLLHPVNPSCCWLYRETRSERLLTGLWQQRGLSEQFSLLYQPSCFTRSDFGS